MEAVQGYMSTQQEWYYYTVQQTRQGLYVPLRLWGRWESRLCDIFCSFVWLACFQFQCVSIMQPH